MTTRREVITGIAVGGMTAAAGLLAACRPQTPTSAQVAGDRLLVRHADGLGLFDTGTGKWLAPPETATATGAALASLENGRLLIRDTQTGQVNSQGKLAGTWVPRATRGGQVALVEGGLGPRSKTTLLVMRAGLERKRFELSGNVEPEAFSANGDQLFVLDYLPPTAPDGYRVRVLNLASGDVTPLLTRLKSIVPPSGEEVMRGQGRRAVYDASRNMLFTLYTHNGDHQHTGQLLGVRPNAPDVHAFIHSLHLSEGWAFCVDLPVPFGLTGAAGHTVAMSADNTTLYAVSAETGTVARVNPSQLTVDGVQEFAPVKGEASAIGLPDGRLLIGAGNQLSVLDGDTHLEWLLDFEVRGLGRGEQLWAGRDAGASTLDVSQRKVLSRVDIPGLLELGQAFARR
jgi:hypothetical protein